MNQGKIKSFTQLDTWKFGHQLVLDIYKITRKFPREELFGLTNQLRRAIISFTSNIAEGWGRFSYKDKIKFYYNSRASVYESLDWLQKAKVRKLITSEEYQKVFSILQALPKEINSLINYTNSHLSV